MPGSSLEKLTIVGNGSTTLEDQSAGIVTDKLHTRADDQELVSRE